nr:uncharacterized protein LOC111511491 [Leptinotarsa decemlineata]
MKLCFGIVLAVTVLVLANAENIGELYRNVESECKKPDAIKPLFLCMNVKFGIQKENGDIDEVVLRKNLAQRHKFGADKINEVINECGVRKGITAGEAGDALRHCLRKYFATV